MYIFFKYLRHIFFGPHTFSHLLTYVQRRRGITRNLSALKSPLTPVHSADLLSKMVKLLFLPATVV